MEHTYTQQISPSDDRRLFYLPHRQIQGIHSIYCDGVLVPSSEYTYSRDEGWVSISTTPLQSLNISYGYSPSLDMVVTNWDPDIGNYLFYNQMTFAAIPDLECSGSISWTKIDPGETIQDDFTISNVGDPSSYLNWEVVSYPEWGTWSFAPSSGENLLAGDSVNVHVMVVAPNEGDSQFQGDIKVVNTANPDDFGLIHVTLSTPYTFVPHPTFYQRLTHFVETMRLLWSSHFSRYS